jgi:phospholipid/cholesterol/gamma-HCH transport system substrate-binding protein
VQRDAAKRIRQDTRARIGSASIVYGKMVLLSMGSPEKPTIPIGDFIPADESSTVSAIVDSTTLVIEGLSRVISKIDRGKGAMSTILNEPLDLQKTLHNLSIASERLVRLFDRLEHGRGTLGSILSDSSADLRRTVRDFQTVATDLRMVTTNLKGSDGALGRLINDPAYTRQTLDDLRSAAGALARITAKIDTGAGTLGLLINDPELYVGLRDVVVGTQKSTVAKWLIRNRRKAGEQERLQTPQPDGEE